jgi:hypothetical protein
LEGLLQKQEYDVEFDLGMEWGELFLTIFIGKVRDVLW